MAYSNLRDIRIDKSKTGGIRSIPTTTSTVPQSATYSFAPNDTVPKSSTGVFTSGNQPLSQVDASNAGVNLAGEQTVVKGGRTYTYRNGKLVNVSQGSGDVIRRNESAAANQAAADFAAQNPDYSGANLGTGGSGVAPGVQSATDAIARLLGSGAYGQQYDPSISALQNMLTENQTALQSGSYLTPINALQDQLTKLYGQSQGNIGAANTALMNYLAANMANPYASLQAQQAVTAPQFSDLLAQQGVSAAPLQAEADIQRQAANDAAAQFQNMAGVLGALQGAGLSSRQAEAQMADTFAKQALEANKAGYGQQLLGMGEDLRQSLQDKIRQGVADVASVQGKKSEDKTTLQGQLVDLLAKGGKLPAGTLKDVFGFDVTDTSKGDGSVKSGEFKTFKDALKAKHPNFKGSVADAKKKFPKLAAKFK